MQGLPFAQLSQTNSYIKPLLGGFERCSLGMFLSLDVESSLRAARHYTRLWNLRFPLSLQELQRLSFKRWKRDIVLTYHGPAVDEAFSALRRLPKLWNQGSIGNESTTHFSGKTGLEPGTLRKEFCCVESFPQMWLTEIIPKTNGTNCHQSKN